MNAQPICEQLLFFCEKVNGLTIIYKSKSGVQKS